MADERTPQEVYDSFHSDPARINTVAALDRKRFGLSGNYEKDLADGKIDEEARIVHPPERTILP